jgi:hypothetical protein
MNEHISEKELIEFVQAFAAKWNMYERDIFDKSEAEEKMPMFEKVEERNAWLQNHKRVDWFDEFGKLLTPLFEQYCTDKKRVYGGPDGRSFGFPAKFNGIENPIETQVTIKNKNRAEVYFKTKTSFKDEYLFVLLCKNGQWKIDNYKQRMYEEEKWENQIL